MDKSFKVLEQCVVEMMDNTLHLEEREFAMQRALSTMSDMVNTYIGGNDMLYSNRVWFAGQDTPIGFNKLPVLSGLMNAYGRDSIIYIESMSMKPFLDKCIEVMVAGVTLWDGTCPILYREGVYYIEEKESSELEVRRTLQSFYRRNEDMYDIDKSYIERRVIQSS